MFHGHDNHRGWHMSGRGGHGFKGGPFGGRGPFGRPGGPFGGGRGRRMFDSGALRLVVLGLIADEPRHGYDIIKALEAKFEGAYSPSPGAIYPMLQMLEEADFVTSQAQGSKRLYAITEQGKAFLAEHQAELDRINAQIAESSDEVSGASLGQEMKALAFAVFSRLRGGLLTAEQAAKARDILKRARRELEDL